MIEKQIQPNNPSFQQQQQKKPLFDESETKGKPKQFYLLLIQ